MDSENFKPTVVSGTDDFIDSDTFGTEDTSTTSDNQQSLVESVAKYFGNAVIAIAALIPSMVPIIVGGKKHTKKKFNKKNK